MCLGTKNAAPASRLQASPSNPTSQGQGALTTAVLGQGLPEGDVGTQTERPLRTQECTWLRQRENSYGQTRDQQIKEPF